MANQRHIHLDGRHFIAIVEDSKVVRIKERRARNTGLTYLDQCLYDFPYWHYTQRQPVRSTSIVARIMEKVYLGDQNESFD